MQLSLIGSSSSKVPSPSSLPSSPSSWSLTGLNNASFSPQRRRSFSMSVSPSTKAASGARWTSWTSSQPNYASSTGRSGARTYQSSYRNSLRIEMLTHPKQSIHVHLRRHLRLQHILLHPNHPQRVRLRPNGRSATHRPHLRLLHGRFAHHSLVVRPSPSPLRIPDARHRHRFHRLHHPAVPGRSP